ncbi:hypothetical protein D5S17_14535 [Pseudonocardiaceae bacterium YIM PH 21723]|nr:hypothetical protein D5S17_14535 [Pseudonocardiaceae bacterium YIM PH 21723]
MASLEELEARISAVERQLAGVRQDAAAARVLAGAADRDVSEFSKALAAHTAVLNALRETQIEQGQQLREHQDQARDGFEKLHAGLSQVTALLTAVLDKDGK